MGILIKVAVTALKVAVSGTIENDIIRAMGNQVFEKGADEFIEYLKKAQKELSTVLTDKNLIKMKIPENRTSYVRAEIRELILSVNVDEPLIRECKYNAENLSEILYRKYLEQKKSSVEYEGEIRKILLVMSEKAIALEKERYGFTADSLIYIIKSVENLEKLFRKFMSDQDEFMKSRREQKVKKRLPDRTQEYYRKWKENMFLNDFDEDDENAGINIPLCRLYQLPFYRLKGQDTNLSNLEERLNKCTQGQDTKSRMLLILGQPGMGKSTLITWFVNYYLQKREGEKREILVYRFTDLDINWNFNIYEDKKRNVGIDGVILEYLNMKKEDLNGKILILDGFDEIAVGSNRMEILNILYNAWARETHIEDFSLLITCRENYIENLSRLLFPYIVLQPWDEEQIENFCRNYESFAKSRIPVTAINKMKNMKDVFGIPIILYMALALEITVKNESSVVEVYDQIFSLEEGGLYDRCLKRGILVSWDKEHRIADIKQQIHQFSREISMWMFENKPQQAEIPKDEYEKIRDNIFKVNDSAGKIQGKDVLIGNYFRVVRCYDGIDTEKLTFVHRSIYEYFVAETICSEIREPVAEMTSEAQEKLAGVLGERLKKGRIDYTIGQYLKAKVRALTVTFGEEEQKHFYIWLEQTAGKMIEKGMLYYTGKDISEYSKVIERELNCFQNVLDILRMFVDFSDDEYIIQYTERARVVFYIRCLTNLVNIKPDVQIDLSKVDLKASYMRKADLRETNLKEANLSEANFSGADFNGASLERANLKEANLIGADLRKAYLKETILSEADLREADLREADLSEANFREADLREANLSGANLRKTNLIGANLKGANLNGVCLKEAYLAGSKWNQEDVEQYSELIKQADFVVIYIGAERMRELTKEEFLIQYPG